MGKRLKWKRPRLQVWGAYFILGLISAGVAILISSIFPLEIRPQVRIICFILWLLAIEIIHYTDEVVDLGDA